MSNPKDILEQFKSNRLESFYRNDYPSMLLYASRRLGEEYAFLAEDCVQNAIFGAWRRCREFSSAAAFRAYIYVCMRNEIVDIFRRHAISQRYATHLDDNLTFVNSYIEQETREIVRRAIEALPEQCRTIFKMSFVNELKNREIATTLGISESLVEKRKAQALKILRHKLNAVD